MTGNDDAVLTVGEMAPFLLAALYVTVAGSLGISAAICRCVTPLAYAAAISAAAAGALLIWLVLP